MRIKKYVARTSAKQRSDAEHFSDASGSRNTNNGKEANAIRRRDDHVGGSDSAASADGGKLVRVIVCVRRNFFPLSNFVHQKKRFKKKSSSVQEIFVVILTHEIIIKSNFYVPVLAKRPVAINNCCSRKITRPVGLQCVIYCYYFFLRHLSTEKQVTDCCTHKRVTYSLLK